jgi:hypothetical protein
VISVSSLEKGRSIFRRPSALAAGILAAVVVNLVVGCGSPAPTTPPFSVASPNAPATAQPTGIVRDAAGDWTFERPATWISAQPNSFITLATGPLVYLSNFALFPTCATSWQATPNPPDSSGNACRLPFTALPPGGVFIQFYSDRLPRPLPTAGEPIEFDGDETHIDVQRPGQCGPIAVDEVAYVAMPQRDAPDVTSTSIRACLNGPDLDQADQSFRAFLASIRSTPSVAYPDACATFELSQRRCEYIVNWARQEAGVAEADAASIELLGDPECPDERDAMSCGVMRTTTFIVRVRVTPSGGESSDHSVFCGLLSDTSLLCSEHPLIRIITPTTNGYWDVPCSGEAPENACATPLPSIEPGAAAAAIPLTITALVIPIDHLGDYSVDLGEVMLPNGVLTEAAVTLADDHPTKLLLNPGFLNLVLRSTQTGAVIDNAYTHGWHMGTERVAVALEFSVERFEPGAELVIADATVR